MRRLPVIQPTVFERRAFLLGLVASVAACASEPDAAPKRGTSSGGPGPSPKDGGGLPGEDAGDDAGPGPLDPPSDAGKDADADAAPAPGCAVAGFEAGPPGSFAMGTLTYVAAANAYIGRDAGGLYGMYALCTHTVGNLTVSATQLTCVVHGARFSLTGELLQGPATVGLPHFAMCLKNGNVAVDPKVIVPPATRLVA
jgi:nitrite reductase/ring-hydroxylating ferredoxin subunit